MVMSGSITSFQIAELVGKSYVIVILDVPWLIARIRFPGTFLVYDGLMEQEVYNMSDYRLFFIGRIGIHVLREVSAEGTHKLIHVSLVRMLQPRLLGVVVFDKPVSLTLYHVCEIGQLPYPAVVCIFSFRGLMPVIMDIKILDLGSRQFLEGVSMAPLGK